MKNTQILRWTLGLTALLAVTLTILFAREHAPALFGVAALAAVPFSLRLAPDAGGGGGAQDEAVFQRTVLSGVEQLNTDVKAVATKQDTLVKDYDRLDKTTKQVFEDITALKKTANDSAADRTALLRKFDQLEVALRLQARGAFGDPLKRISADEDLRLRFNAAVRLAVSGGSDDMGRLVRTKFPAEFVKRALGEDSSPGSTLINDALAQEIYDTLALYGVWNTFAIRRLGTATTKFPVKTARATAGFVLTEGGTVADNTATTGTTVSCTVEMIAALINVSIQLLEDAEFDVVGAVLRDFAEAYALVQDWACLRADGTADATNGGMTGIFGGGGTAAVAATGHTTVETLSFEDVTKCLLTVDAALLSRPGRWWMHPHTLVRMLSIKDSNGRPIFLTAMEAPTPGGVGSILGRPVTLAHAAPSANTASSKVAAFGDPEALVAGVRTDFKFEACDHHRWNTLERSFRGYGRFGTKIRKATGFAVLTNAAS